MKQPSSCKMVHWTQRSINDKKFAKARAVNQTAYRNVITDRHNSPLPAQVADGKPVSLTPRKRTTKIAPIQGLRIHNEMSQRYVEGVPHIFRETGRSRFVWLHWLRDLRVILLLAHASSHAQAGINWLTCFPFCKRLAIAALVGMPSLCVFASSVFLLKPEN
ncbi:hypothetical protein BJ741DRAFT_594995 [Chytriomyces cf. hyalinus JEL632]|nr:hypothetical protein BJ741DRAFT_594995 [Chytriomyces cf. hyalinus JEL632]